MNHDEMDEFHIDWFGLVVKGCILAIGFILGAAVVLL